MSGRTDGHTNGHTNGHGKNTNGTTDLVTLANNIAAQTASLATYLKDNHLAPPSFAADSSELPETAEYLAVHSSLTTSLEDLQRLVDGPKRSLRSFVCQGNDLAAFQVACDFDFFTIVPVQGDISLENVAQRAGLDVDRVARVIRMLATHRIFHEPRAGFISHTAASYAIANDEELRCAGHYMVDEMLKAATETSKCLKASPHESDSSHSPFNTRHGVPMFTYYAQNPKFAARFAKAMAGAAKIDRQISELRDCFPWEKLKGKVVDVGGGSGHISIALAKIFPHLNFVVQDASTDMLAQGKELVGSLQDRINFMQYSFFEPQPQRDVAAFFIRQCTHNWCDRDVVTIFKGFVPGLEGSEPGTPLLINDTVMPEPGVRPAHEERALRQLDILMLVGLGAKQRTKAEFEALLKEADPRFEIVSVHTDGPMGLLEVHLKH